MRANVTVVSWQNAVSLDEELHQRELTAVAEEMASSVAGAVLEQISELVLASREEMTAREK